MKWGYEVKGKAIAKVLSDSSKFADTFPDSLAKGFASGDARNEAIKEVAVSHIVGITLNALLEKVTVKIPPDADRCCWRCHSN